MAAPPDQYWRDVLTGAYIRLRALRRVMQMLDSPPRCKLCAAPFGRPWGPVLRWIGKGRSAIHPLLCKMCFRNIYQRHRGGAEVELSLLFADVRGSTAMAEGIPPAQFGDLLNRFYEISSSVIDEEGGMVDKYLGDGVFAMFIPGFSGPDHARHAIEAGRRLVAATKDAEAGLAWIPVGVGVHSGTAYTGVVGGGPEMLDFTAVGDAVNVASRLGSTAQPGQLLVSAATVNSAEMDTAGFDRRRLRLEGRQEEIDTFVIT